MPAREPSATDFEGLLRALKGGGVEFILIGAATVTSGLNFTLQTSLGHIDLLGEIAGGGGYEQLLPSSHAADLLGVECLVLGLEKLILVKRAAGRPKDLEAIAELEAIREERQKRGL